MTDQVIDVVEPEATEEQTVTEQIKTDKTFLQADVNAIVSKEVRRVKKLHDEELTRMTEESTLLRGHLEKLVSSRLAGLPEDIQTLVRELDVSKQIEWLDKNATKYVKQAIKPVPEANDGVQSTADLVAKKRQSGIYG
jgi:hypothetical protein